MTCYDHEDVVRENGEVDIAPNISIQKLFPDADPNEAEHDSKHCDVCDNDTYESASLYD